MTVDVLNKVKDEILVSTSIEVQTIRLATNTFEDYLNLGQTPADIEVRQAQLNTLDTHCRQLNISYVALGPSSTTYSTLKIIPQIIRTTNSSKSTIFSASANVPFAEVSAARAVAETVKDLATVEKGMGNFNFCSVSCVSPYVPFFPAACAPRKSQLSESEMKRIRFAIGLENGKLAATLLKKTGSIQHVHRTFLDGLSLAYSPIVVACEKVASLTNSEYIGLDSSLNPSLEAHGSVAQALEQLDELTTFGGNGSLAVASAVTTALQSLPIKLTGYCGLMLPVCEDNRLSELAAFETSKVSITNLLSISSCCGVGVDTVPVEGDVGVESLTSLILDVAGLAGRWNKPLSCRVFPVSGKKVGDMTTFEEGGWLCNTRVFDC